MSDSENPQSLSVDSNMAYETARGELIKIVNALESGQAPLEESLKLWEQGEALATHCQNILDNASQRLNELNPGANLNQ